MPTVLKSALDALRESIFGESFITEAGLTNRQIAFVYQGGTFLDKKWVAEEPFNFESDDPQLVLSALSEPYYGDPVLQSVRQTIGLVDRLENEFSANEFMDKLNSVRAKLDVVEITPKNVNEYRDKEINADVVVVTTSVTVTSIRARVLICNESIKADRIFVSHYAFMVAPKINVRDLIVPCRGYLITSDLNIRDIATTSTVSVSLVDRDPIRIWAFSQNGTIRVQTESWSELGSEIVDEFHQCCDYVCRDSTVYRVSDTSWLARFSNPEPESEVKQSQSESAQQQAQTQPESKPQQEPETPDTSVEEAPEASTTEAGAPEASTVDAAEDSQKPEPAETESADDAYVKIQPESVESDNELYDALHNGTTNRILEKLFVALGIPVDGSMGKTKKIQHLLNLCRKDRTDATRSNVLAALAGIKAQAQPESKPQQKPETPDTSAEEPEASTADAAENPQKSE